MGASAAFRRLLTGPFEGLTEISPRLCRGSFNFPLLSFRLHLLNQESHGLLRWPVSEPGGTIMMFQAFRLPSCMRLRRALSLS